MNTGQCHSKGSTDDCQSADVTVHLQTTKQLETIMPDKLKLHKCYIELSKIFFKSLYFIDLYYKHSTQL